MRILKHLPLHPVQESPYVVFIISAKFVWKLTFFFRVWLQTKVVEELMDEIRRLKSLLVKHEKRIRALEARAASSPSADLNNSTGSANTSLVADSPPATTANNPQQSATTGGGQHENNHVTHDTNANVAKTIAAEDMAPDEVWTHQPQVKIQNSKKTNLSCTHITT